MEAVSCSSRPHAGEDTRRELGDRKEGESGGYDSCPRFSVQWRTPKGMLILVSRLWECLTDQDRLVATAITRNEDHFVRNPQPVRTILWILLTGCLGAKPRRNPRYRSRQVLLGRWRFGERTETADSSRFTERGAVS